MATNIVANAAATSPRAAEELSALVICAVIMVIAALIGGAGAYLTRDDRTETGTWNALWRFILLGLIASACVPLFLSLVRSGIIETILANKEGRRLESYLIFGGLCLLASYSARSFITSISRRVLQQVEEAREEAREAKETALEVADERAAEPISPARFAKLTGEAKAGPKVDMTDNERAVLLALTRMSFRTASGAAAEAGISRMAVGEALDELTAKGLVEMTHSPNTKRIRWAITPQGIAALKAG